MSNLYDYLLAYAVVGQADNLITGDKDLLDLKEIGEVTVISPTDFRQLLAASLKDGYRG